MKYSVSAETTKAQLAVWEWKCKPWGKKRLKIIWVEFPVANSLSFQLTLTNLYSANGAGSIVIRLAWFNTSSQANEKCWFHVKKDFPVLFHGDLFPKRKKTTVLVRANTWQGEGHTRRPNGANQIFFFINLKKKININTG